MEGCCGLNWWNFGQKLEAGDSLERFALFYNFDFIFTLDPSQEKRIKAKRGHFRLRNACQQISGYPSPLPPLCQLISAWGRQSEIARYIFHYFPSFYKMYFSMHAILASFFTTCIAGSVSLYCGYFAFQPVLSSYLSQLPLLPISCLSNIYNI